MTSLESMIKKLSPLGIYSLNENSVVYAELAAFSEGLDLLKECLEELLKEGFVSTAESYGIESLERLTGCVRDDLPLSQRRGMLLKRFSLDSSDFTPEGFAEMLSILGVEGEIVESPRTGRISLVLDGEFAVPEREWIVAQAEELLPAHLEWDAVFEGFCWADSDSKGNTFAFIDSKGYDWYKIDYII